MAELKISAKGLEILAEFLDYLISIPPQPLKKFGLKHSTYAEYNLICL